MKRLLSDFVCSFCMCFWSLFPQAIDEFRVRRDAMT